MFFFSIKVNAQDYFLGIFSENYDITTVGHAFIGIGKGTPLTCDIDGNETELWGFYPRSKIEGGLSFFSGPVDSKIASDVFTKINHYFFFQIDSSDYFRVLAQIETWKKKRYELTRSDCISFLIDISSLFPNKILIPERKPTDTPDNYVKKLIDKNKLE